MDERVEPQPTKEDGKPATGERRTVNEEKLLLEAHEVAYLLSIGRTTLYNLVATGSMPEPIRLSSGIVRWSAEEIRAWVRAGCPPREIWLTIKKGAAGHRVRK